MKKWCLVFILGILIFGMSPVFAQESGRNVIVIDLGDVSDAEFTRALEAASGIELINKEDEEAAPEDEKIDET